MTRSVDSTANLITGLQILQSLGDAIPAGGIVKSVAGIGITLLETAERVRVNREECFRIAEKAAEHILVLKTHLEDDEHLSDDLQQRLCRYLWVLQEVAGKVGTLGKESRLKRTFKTASVQDETNDCINKLNEAYQLYLFQSSIAVERGVTCLKNCIRSLSLSSDKQVALRPYEPDEIPRIPVACIKFGEEIKQIRKRNYILRVEHGEMVDDMGRRNDVVVRKFEALGGCAEDAASDEFEREVELRRGLLHQYFARMLGIAIASRRTKMIIVEAETIGAYDYLQSLPAVNYFYEWLRIMSECVSGYRFLHDHGGSWNGGLRAIVLRANEKRLSIGGLGHIDGQIHYSGTRLTNAFHRLRDGWDVDSASTYSFDYYAHLYTEIESVLRRWRAEKSEAIARTLWDKVWWWGGVLKNEEFEGVGESLSAGDIGWMEGSVWHPIPIVHQFPAAKSPQYDIMASRWCGGEWEPIEGVRSDGFTRWSIACSPRETIYLQTWIRSSSTAYMDDFFYGSALSLGEHLKIDASLLRLVTTVGLQMTTSITVPEDPEHRFLYFHYFAYPLNADGTVPDPPGFWPIPPNPLGSADERLAEDQSEAWFDVDCFRWTRVLDDPTCVLLQELKEHGFLPISTITFPSHHSSASIRVAEKLPSPKTRMRRNRLTIQVKKLFSKLGGRKKKARVNSSDRRYAHIF